MELNLVGKPKPPIQRALRAVLAPLQDYWGDPAGFRVAATPTLVREAGSTLASAKEAMALATQAYRLVARLRAANFRAADTPVRADTIYKALEPAANSGLNSALTGSCLWLAHRMQTAALAYLRSPEAQNALTKVWVALPARSEIPKAAAADDALDLERLETLIADDLPGLVGFVLGRFQRYALAGHLLERARALARALPDRPGAEGPVTAQSAEERALAVLAAPAHAADLNEARARFATLEAEESAKRFEAFKVNFAKVVAKAAPVAPLGYEKFYRAVEALLYPYPAPLEWVRPFIKPVYFTASQSTIFSDCLTPQSIVQRYEMHRQTKQGSSAILELARAFALSKVKVREVEKRQSFMLELDLVKEFGWPGSLADLRKQWEERSR